MKLISAQQGRAGAGRDGHTLAETVIAIGVLGLVCAGVYGAMSASCGTVQMTRENLRANQILLQTLEVVRLCNWNQTNPATNFIPTSLTQPFFTDGSTVTNGPYYQLTVTMTNAPATSDSYSNDLRMIQIQAAWTSCGVNHLRTMSTYISKWGLQNYVW
jgi:type II secretory pathway pseudopilin PulG